MSIRLRWSFSFFDRFAALLLALVLCLIVGIGLLLLHTSNQQNEASIKAEEVLVQAMLDESRRQLASSITEYAVWDDMYQRVGGKQRPDLDWFDSSTTETLYSKLNIDLMLLSEAEGPVFRLMLKGQWHKPAEFDLGRQPDWQRFLRDTLALAPGEVLARDLVWDKHVYWVVAQRVQSQTQPEADSSRVLLFARCVDQARLSDILAAQRLQDLVLVAGARPDAANVVTTRLTKPLYASWTPTLSGSAFLRAIIQPAMWLVVMVLLICYALLRNARSYHRALLAVGRRQDGQRAATVALVELVYSHRQSEDGIDEDFWRLFAGILAQTLQGRRFSLVLYGEHAPEQVIFDVVVPADRAIDGMDIVGVPLARRAELARDFVLMHHDVFPRASAAIMRDGRLVGELIAERGGRLGWQQDEGNFLVSAAALAALSLEASSRRGIEYALHRHVHFDPLTGLSSALRLSQELDSLRHSWSGMVVVAVLRLEGLEDVNLLLGREGGDRLLVELADRLLDLLEEDELVARSGGKRFDLLLHAAAPERVQARLAAMVDALMAPYQLGEHAYRPQCRIGATHCPAEALGVARLQEATLALDQAYHSKESVVWFGEHLRASTERRLALAQAMRQAVAQGGLTLAYQPFVDARTGKPVGAEVLLRWTHAELGPISPVEFIPIAEETGLIVELGEWVLDTALRQLSSWQQTLPVRLKLAINLSPRQLTDANLAARLLAILQGHDVDSSQLEFEVTEGLALDDSPEISANLSTLQAARVNIAIDDFGTGYATFSYLRRYQVEKIKLDKQFIDDLQNEASRLLVRSMITMGKGLGASVTAEGVEQAQQWQLLREMGCDYIQGYYFSRPLPADAFALRIAELLERADGTVPPAQPVPAKG
ncbi:bifunctional diguanylate cyclase/phosphodiesterase [Chitinimonas arctica]|nr:EAL domain-containing protein [Chitinimonas arctica]